MPIIILIGDSDTGHEKHGPTQVITGLSTVKVDGNRSEIYDLENLYLVM